MREPMSSDDRLALLRAHTALSAGDSQVARRHLATLSDMAICDEIDAVIRAGLYDGALHRLHLLINPKFQSSDACLRHVGSTSHYRKPKEGNLL